eukprot:m.92612 g.92612  ORF g.92612 m.92612 type:complete len:230 (+) comp20233_c0_seq1:353-1042(+)
MVVWLPLESNPDVINKFLGQLGVSTEYQAFDVFGTDPELLVMVPQPCIAVLLLFPMSEAHEAHSAVQKAKIEAEGQEVAAPASTFYMTQTIGNACGTIGIIHAIANHTDKIKLEDGGFMQEYLERVKDLGPDAKCEALEQTEGVAEKHEAAAQEGQTEVAEDTRVNAHFICITYVDNTLIELDGRKGRPISHGATTADTFLADATKVCKDFMARDPDSVDFTMMAVSKA